MPSRVKAEAVMAHFFTVVLMHAQRHLPEVYAEANEA